MNKWNKLFHKSLYFSQYIWLWINFFKLDKKEIYMCIHGNLEIWRKKSAYHTWTAGGSPFRDMPVQLISPLVHSFTARFPPLLG